jgi:predicted nucleotidyltransferase
LEEIYDVRHQRTLTFSDESQLYGVTQQQVERILEIIKGEFGSQIHSLFAFGSRVYGKRSVLKGSQPSDENSDLDLLLVTSFFPFTDNIKLERIADALKASREITFPVDLHVISPLNVKEDSRLITSHHAGEEANFTILEDPHSPKARRPESALEIFRRL